MKKVLNFRLNLINSNLLKKNLSITNLNKMNNFNFKMTKHIKQVRTCKSSFSFSDKVKNETKTDSKKAETNKEKETKKEEATKEEESQENDAGDERKEDSTGMLLNLK